MASSISADVHVSDCTRATTATIGDIVTVVRELQMIEFNSPQNALHLYDPIWVINIKYAHLNSNTRSYYGYKNTSGLLEHYFWITQNLLLTGQALHGLTTIFSQIN